jgi:diguanylate cyclase (GGDEF)-like protein/PAS domain S-box-containing protein
MPMATGIALSLVAGYCAGVASMYLARRRRGSAGPDSLYRIDDAPLPMLIVDASGRIVAANALLEQLFGYAAGELNGRPLELLIPRESRVHHIDLRESYFARPLPRPMSQRDLHGLHKGGHPVPVEIGLSVVPWNRGIATLATVIDASEKRRWQRELIDTHALLSAMIQSMPFSVIATDLEGSINAMSPAAERMLGYRSDELVGRCTPEIIHDAAEIRSRARELSEELQQPVPPGFEVFAAKPRRGSPESRVWTYVRKDGSRLSVQLTVSAICNAQQEIVGFIGVAYDITDQRQRDELLSQLAYYDALTGLPNRTLLKDRLLLALERANRFGLRVALMLVDLDNFKQINDSLGHAAGDRVLIATGERLRACVRGLDTVARLGGDEFVVVLSDVRDRAQVEPIANKIVAAISSPIPHSSMLLRVTPSIGISFFPDHGNEMETLLHRADIAMYDAKKSGRGSARFFAPASAPGGAEGPLSR